jgi:hypothetical protein
LLFYKPYPAVLIGEVEFLIPELEAYQFSIFDRSLSYKTLFLVKAASFNKEAND